MFETKQQMTPEQEDGNVEYKLKLLNSSMERIDSLASQMRYRCEEGNGECIYNIGVEDNGDMTGITLEEYTQTINVLTSAAKKNQYTISLLKKTVVSGDLAVYEVLVRESNQNKYIDIKVAIAGNVDVGKCEAMGTQVRLYPTGTKEIQDITIDDVLMGDDGTPRKVLETTSGIGEMYDIKLQDDSVITVNKNHVLSFIVTNPCKLFYPDIICAYYKLKYLVVKKTSCAMKKSYAMKTEVFDNEITATKFMNKVNKLIGSTFDMALSDWVFLSNDTKKCMTTYKMVDFKQKHIVLCGIVDVTVSEKTHYYGFELDGNGRYLHADNLVTHNSSFLGVLTSGKNDNGRGLARSAIFNYPHEIKTGRTSSIGHHILGFDHTGQIVNYKAICSKMTWPEIVHSSAKVISFFDLAGHEKYLKTTILGLASTQPDICFILVGANKGIRNEKYKAGDDKTKQKTFENMTKEHIFLCITLGIPFAIVITKTDMIEDQKIQNVYEQTLQDIHAIVRQPGVRRQAIKVDNIDDVIVCAKQIYTESIVPIFSISNVTGKGFEHITKFLNILPKSHNHQKNEYVLFNIENVWSVPGIGTVVGGNLTSGTIKVGDKLYIGPKNDKYNQVVIRSIHCKRVSVQQVACGSFICLAVKYDKNQIRRGLVIVSDKSQHTFVTEFTADIKVMKSHSTTIRVGYEPVVHISSIRQSVVLTDISNKINYRNSTEIDDKILRTGDMATATFRFKYHSEYIVPDMKILLCEGKTKVIGVIKTVNTCI